MNHYIVKWVASYLDICVRKTNLLDACREDVIEAAETMVKLRRKIYRQDV